jgi:phenylacetate-CoA ligase
MDKLDLYYSLPYPFKIIGASLYGYRLRSLRYGKDTEKLVEETLERDTWSKEKWQSWREERLAYILDLAATSVPYYINQWQARRRNGDRASWDILENWPKLDKAVVRENPRQFVSDKSAGKPLFIDHTGGTTGKPTLIYMGRKVALQWSAIYEARIRRWLGLTYKDRWGIFGGQKVISLEQKQPPFWVWNQGLHQVYFSIFHIKRENAKAYIDALKHYSPNYLIVYPSALSLLSRFILQDHLPPPQLKAIISNSERLTTQYKNLIEDAFNCPVTDTYGMAEMSSAANTCSQGIMHYWPETGYMEIYDPKSNQFSINNQTGLFCMTSLLNEDMPLIRYVNGDAGNLPQWLSACKCGRSLPVMGQIQGRSNDLILTQDGRELYILDSLFNGLPLIEAQLIQKDMNMFDVKVVADKGYDRSTVTGVICSRLIKYLGEIKINVISVNEIEKDINGKFRPFISQIHKTNS